MQFSFFASCAKFIEDILDDELKSFGAINVKRTVAGVYFSGNLEVAYSACLYSRVANNIYLGLSEFEAESPEDLYANIQDVNWLDHMGARSTFKIDVTGKHSNINNTQYIAQKAKDAIVDQIREIEGSRPNIDTYEPDLVINLHTYGNKFSLSISLSGESLHRRGYRSETGKAPLKETLAAAILIRSGWLTKVKNKPCCLIDPMCGSGTILIEAATMAYGIAPNVNRDYYGFLGWKKHDHDLWISLLNKAIEHKEKMLNLSDEDSSIEIRGFDNSSYAIDHAYKNVDNAQLESLIRINKCNIKNLDNDDINFKTGLILFNPPYGERMSHDDEDKLKQLFKDTGKNFIKYFTGWEVNIFTANPESIKSLGIRSFKAAKFYNGALEAKLLKFKIEDKYIMKFETEAERQLRIEQKIFDEADGGSIQFLNRLKKNHKRLNKWAIRNNITCYRVYDADLPEYAVAIDLYNDFAHIQEYQAGKDVDENKAKIRIKEAIYHVHKFFDIPYDKISTKLRKRQKGKDQYNKIEAENSFFEVSENGAKYYVNLTDYLDTGLFLDHRNMRAEVASNSKGKKLLNLFAYTCSATVLAALNGAKSSVSVDMSNTYLDWAEKNFRLNNINLNKHKLIHDDYLKWLEDSDDKFDLIFLDPPTFSNSKRMENTLDVQRDHPELIDLSMQRLLKNGILYFSTNCRKFKLDDNLAEDYICKNISHNMLPEDFKRRPNIHHCFKITWK